MRRRRSHEIPEKYRQKLCFLRCGAHFCFAGLRADAEAAASRKNCFKEWADAPCDGKTRSANREFRGDCENRIGGRSCRAGWACDHHGGTSAERHAEAK